MYTNTDTHTHTSVMCHNGVCLLTGNTHGFMCQMAEISMEKKERRSSKMRCDDDDGGNGGNDGGKKYKSKN